MANSVILKPVDANFSLTDHIYGVLRGAIVEMDLYDEATDLRLDERRMADQLGVSRTPVREALVRLEHEGFVDIQPRRGVFLKRKDLTEICEMITVWAALESMAARLGCAQADDAQIAELRRICRQFSPEDAKARLNEYSEANIDFHLCILGLSGCAMLQEIAQELFAHLKPVRRRAMRDSARADRSFVDHLNIIEAIEARDADLAERLVREHTFNLRAYIQGAWRNLVDKAAE